MSQSPKVVIGKVATEEEVFYVKWGRESLKATVPTLNDVMTKIVTLVTALIGGGLVIAKGDIVPQPWSIIAVGMLIGSLAASLVGLFPMGRAVCWDCPDDVRDFEHWAIRRKLWCLRISGVLLLLALTTALVGLSV